MFGVNSIETRKSSGSEFHVDRLLVQYSDKKETTSMTSEGLRRTRGAESWRHLADRRRDWELHAIRIKRYSNHYCGAVVRYIFTIHQGATLTSKSYGLPEVVCETPD